MDTHQALAGLVGTVEARNGIEDALDGAAGKIIPKNIQADL